MDQCAASSVACCPPVSNFPLQQEEQYVGVPKSSVVESTPKMASLLEQAFDWGGYQKVPVALFEAGGLVLLGDCQTDSGNHVKIRWGGHSTCKAISFASSHPTCPDQMGCVRTHPPTASLCP